MKQKILVATTNPGKIQELRALLDLPVTWLGLSDIGSVPKVVEDGQTFAENARKKAATYAKASGLWTLSDDSGLMVDALHGQPGVRSARFAGIESPDYKTIDQKNMEKVLSLLRSVPWHQRTCRFVCCLCLAAPDTILLETQGILEGLIAEEPAGCHGFGYDPIFFVTGIKKTVAQLGQHQKNSISHRGQAIYQLKLRLATLLARPT